MSKRSFAHPYLLDGGSPRGVTVLVLVTTVLRSTPLTNLFAQVYADRGSRFGSSELTKPPMDRQD